MPVGLVVAARSCRDPGSRGSASFPGRDTCRTAWRELINGRVFGDVYMTGSREDTESCPRGAGSPNLADTHARTLARSHVHTALGIR